MACEHLQPILESERDSGLLCQVANFLARGHVPPTALQVLRLGRVTALKKPDGGVRIELLGQWRNSLHFVCRNSDSSLSMCVDDASECVSHVLQTLTDLDPSATILSVDGVGAFDLVSRNAMLQGLMGMEGGDRFLPFVRPFQ